MLTVTAFFCFFFSYAWVIVNKGSSFWQKNWERHIDVFEKEVIGQMFNIIMNEGSRKRCSPTPTKSAARSWCWAAGGFTMMLPKTE